MGENRAFYIMGNCDSIGQSVVKNGQSLNIKYIFYSISIFGLNKNHLPTIKIVLYAQEHTNLSFPKLHYDISK